jgi:hypothetical protein
METYNPLVPPQVASVVTFLVPVAVGAAPVVVGALGNGVRGGVIIDHPTIQRKRHRGKEGILVLYGSSLGSQADVHLPGFEVAPLENGYCRYPRGSFMKVQAAQSLRPESL